VDLLAEYTWTIFGRIVVWSERFTRRAKMVLLPAVTAMRFVSPWLVSSPFSTIFGSTFFAALTSTGGGDTLAMKNPQQFTFLTRRARLSKGVLHDGPGIEK
jgi:hypothetical protein